MLKLAMVIWNEAKMAKFQILFSVHNDNADRPTDKVAIKLLITEESIDPLSIGWRWNEDNADAI